MADNAKAKSAKERLEAAKRMAEEAEILDSRDTEPAAETGESSEPEAEIAEGGDAAETAETVSDASEADAETAAGDAAASDDVETSDDAVSEAADPTEAEHAPAEPELEEPSGSIAATILKFLAILVVGAIAALWAGPKIAPNLPGWASPVATFLTPGANEADMKIDAVAEEGRKERAMLSTQIETASGEAAAAAQKASDASAAIEQARADLGAEIASVAEEPRADLGRMNDLAQRLVTAEATVEGLRAEIDALGGITTEGAAPSAEVLERVAAFGASVEGLRAEIADLKARTSQIEALAKSEDLAALTARVAALEDGEAATAGARDEATDIRRTANIAAAMTRIEQALLSGAPYASALADVTSLSGESAPAALSDAAAAGVPTQESLANGFPVAAQAAYAAALAENAGDGFAGGVFAKLQGRLGGRPSVETEGDDAGAVLSRVEARLKEGRLRDALSEANGLSDAARGAMAGWLADLARAADGAAAFAEYRNTVTTN